jgi:choline-sulfatase
MLDRMLDPEELVDRASDPAYRGALEDCRKRLYAMLDPDAVDQRAKNRQAELLAEFGGREKALARGDLGFTPAPGTNPDMD